MKGKQYWFLLLHTNGGIQFIQKMSCHLQSKSSVGNNLKPFVVPYQSFNLLAACSDKVSCENRSQIFSKLFDSHLQRVYFSNVVQLLIQLAVLLLAFWPFLQFILQFRYPRSYQTKCLSFQKIFPFNKFKTRNKDKMKIPKHFPTTFERQILYLAI